MKKPDVLDEGDLLEGLPSLNHLILAHKVIHLYWDGDFHCSFFFPNLIQNKPVITNQMVFYSTYGMSVRPLGNYFRVALKNGSR